MAGTLTDKSTLATDNAFINKCRVSMITRALTILRSTSVQSFTDLNQMRLILQNAGSDAPLMAWRVVAGSPAIGAAAPAVPNDTDTDQAVTTILALLY